MTKRALAALVLLAFAGTACEDPSAGPSALSGSSPTAVTTVAPTTTRPATTRPATPKPVATTQAAAKPTPTPVPVRATAKPKPLVASTCGAPANPWGYSFCGGSYISSPPASFCDYFDCIASFWENTKGYVMQCEDHTFSHSGGRSGSCSHHGGNLRPLNR